MALRASPKYLFSIRPPGILQSLSQRMSNISLSVTPIVDILGFVKLPEKGLRIYKFIFQLKDL